MSKEEREVLKQERKAKVEAKRAGLGRPLEVVNDQGKKVAVPRGGGPPMAKALLGKKLAKATEHEALLGKQKEQIEAAITEVQVQRAAAQAVYDEIDDD